MQGLSAGMKALMEEKRLRALELKMSRSNSSQDALSVNPCTNGALTLGRALILFVFYFAARFFFGTKEAACSVSPNIFVLGTCSNLEQAGQGSPSNHHPLAPLVQSPPSPQQLVPVPSGPLPSSSQGLNSEQRRRIEEKAAAARWALEQKRLRDAQVQGGM